MSEEELEMAKGEFSEEQKKFYLYLHSLIGTYQDNWINDDECIDPFDVVQVFGVVYEEMVNVADDYADFIQNHMPLIREQERAFEEIVNNYDNE